MRESHLLAKPNIRERPRLGCLGQFKTKTFLIYLFITECTHVGGMKVKNLLVADPRLILLPYEMVWGGYKWERFSA